MINLKNTSSPPLSAIINRSVTKYNQGRNTGKAAPAGNGEAENLPE